MLPLLVSLLIILKFNEVVADPKIIFTWGEPLNYTYYLNFTNETYWNDCINTCLSETDCVLISELEGMCQMFREGCVSTVKVLDKSSGKRVGFKRDFNQCPNSGTPPLFGEISVQEAKYSLTSTKSDEGDEILQFSFKCGVNAFYSTQRPTPVCISILPFPSPYMGDHKDAEDLCTAHGAMSLTGPYEDVEFLRTRTRWVEITNYIDRFTPGYVHTKTKDLWADGCCGSTGKDCTFADETLYGTTRYDSFAINFGNTSDRCSFVSPKAPYNYLMDSNHTSVDNSGWFRGAMCRVAPVF